MIIFRGFPSWRPRAKLHYRPASKAFAARTGASAAPPTLLSFAKERPILTATRNEYRLLNKTEVKLCSELEGQRAQQRSSAPDHQAHSQRCQPEPTRGGRAVDFMSTSARCRDECHRSPLWTLLVTIPKSSGTSGTPLSMNNLTARPTRLAAVMHIHQRLLMGALSKS